MKRIVLLLSLWLPAGGCHQDISQSMRGSARLSSSTEKLKNRSGEKSSDNNEGIPGYLVQPSEIKISKLTDGDYFVEGYAGAIRGTGEVEKIFVSLWLIPEQRMSDQQPIGEQLITKVIDFGKGFSLEFSARKNGILALTMSQHNINQATVRIPIDTYKPNWAYSQLGIDDEFSAENPLDIEEQDDGNQGDDDGGDNSGDPSLYAIRLVTGRCRECRSRNDINIKVSGPEQSHQFTIEPSNEEQYRNRQTFIKRFSVANLGKISQVEISVDGEDNLLLRSLSIRHFRSRIRTIFSEGNRWINRDNSILVPTEEIKLRRRAKKNRR